MKAVMIVAAHKPYWMPGDPLYLPVQVGAAGKPSLGWQRDDAGDEISGKNASFCELTGLYWAWRNLEADALGLAHYRRYFATGSRLRPKRERLLGAEEAARLLTECDLILPRKRHYVIETNESQYVHAHHAVDLERTREILAERDPDAAEAWDRVMRRRSGHRFNMFLMKKPLADAYCEWLFPILFELEKRLDISGYADKRVFGYVGERLMDVWVERNRLAPRELPVVNLESQHWPRKIAAFLRRKLRA